MLQLSIGYIEKASTEKQIIVTHENCNEAQFTYIKIAFQ